MKIKINDFTTWPDNFKKIEEVHDMIDAGHYVVLELNRSDFNLTDLMRIRNEFGPIDCIIEEKLYLKDEVRDHKDGRASCRIELFRKGVKKNE